jgi:YHS domain-containing protein
MDLINYPQISNINVSKHTLLNTFVDNTANLFVPDKASIVLGNHAAKLREHNGSYLELLFHGLNYSNKRIKMRRAKYFCDVHRSEVYFCNEKVRNTFKSKVFKRRIIFFSYDTQVIERIKLIITQFKQPNTYTGKGIFSREDLYSTREGKKR